METSRAHLISSTSCQLVCRQQLIKTRVSYIVEMSIQHELITQRDSISK